MNDSIDPTTNPSLPEFGPGEWRDPIDNTEWLDTAHSGVPRSRLQKLRIEVTPETQHIKIDGKIRAKHVEIPTSVEREGSPHEKSIKKWMLLKEDCLEHRERPDAKKAFAEADRQQIEDGEHAGKWATSPRLVVRKLLTNLGLEDGMPLLKYWDDIEPSKGIPLLERFAKDGIPWAYDDRGCMRKPTIIPRRHSRFGSEKGFWLEEEVLEFRQILADLLSQPLIRHGKGSALGPFIVAEPNRQPGDRIFRKRKWFLRRNLAAMLVGCCPQSFNVWNERGCSRLPRDKKPEVYNHQGCEYDGSPGLYFAEDEVRIIADAFNAKPTEPEPLPQRPADADLIFYDEAESLLGCSRQTIDRIRRKKGNTGKVNIYPETVSIVDGREFERPMLRKSELLALFVPKPASGEPIIILLPLPVGCQIVTVNGASSKPIAFPLPLPKTVKLTDGLFARYKDGHGNEQIRPVITIKEGELRLASTWYLREDLKAHYGCSDIVPYSWKDRDLETREFYVIRDRKYREPKLVTAFSGWQLDDIAAGKTKGTQRLCGTSLYARENSPIYRKHVEEFLKEMKRHLPILASAANALVAEAKFNGSPLGTTVAWKLRKELHIESKRNEGRAWWCLQNAVLPGADRAQEVSAANVEAFKKAMPDFFKEPEAEPEHGDNGYIFRPLLDHLDKRFTSVQDRLASNHAESLGAMKQEGNETRATTKEQHAASMAKHAETQTRIGALENAQVPNEVIPPDCMVYHGGKAYSIGEFDPINLTVNEHEVVNPFIDLPAMDKKTLIELAKGNDNAPRTLGSLVNKYEGRFAPAIKTPGFGGKATGGYSVKIRKSPQFLLQESQESKKPV